MQHGLPGFPQSGRQLHFELIKEWIRLCDEGECSRRGGCRPDRDRVRIPTRVIDVGDGDTAHLVLTGEMGLVTQYVALSHCWGRLPKEQTDKWCTTTSNDKERRTQGFPIANLAQTFRDAITVTRELGQRYLWIDSLCIIQDDHRDWETESKKMEAVFQHAYCTIAATSAEHSDEGFLNRPEEKYSQYVMVPESSDGKVYICTSIDDDFDVDVMKGILNTRAWVLQERALSRRTIHFTKRQTYWECGGGVRCETLTHMKK
jgi:Heterokaryon incompatibility protein (HET)